MADFIKRYFLDQYQLSGNLKIDFRCETVERDQQKQEDWAVNLINTGLQTNTGGRLLRLKPLLCDGTFLLTYGDGVSDVAIDKLLAFHRQQGRVATVSAVRPPARFGGLEIEHGEVRKFSEKPSTGEGWINGGFMAMEPAIFDYLEGDDCSLEANALERVASDGQLAAYCHEGFWQCMDTLRDKQYLESLWDTEEAPWRTWEESEASEALQYLKLAPTNRRAA